MRIHVNKREEKFDRRRCASIMSRDNFNAANIIRVAPSPCVFGDRSRCDALSL
jgi:hypothetical protein